MKTIIKNIKTFAVILLLSATASSCSDLLDQRPQGQWTMDDIEGGAYASEVMALYSDIRSYNITAGIPAFLVHMVRSEDSNKGTTATDGPENGVMWDDFQYDPSNGPMKAYWTHNYTIIHKANTIIDKLKAEPELSPIQETLYGECTFFRAYCYFNLVRAFGQVPLIDYHLASSADANKPKSTEAEIYKLIDQDLTKAEQTLPPSWESRYIGRLTSGAAFALHARAYMQRNDWGNMLSSAQFVMNSKKYDLETPFDKIFREESENGSESVWELQCTATKALPADLSIGSQFCEVQGVRGSGDNNLGWGWHMATDEIVNAFESGDPRKDETLLYYTRPGETWAQMVTKYGAPADGNLPYKEKFESNDCIGRFFNKKAYCSKTMRASFGRTSGFWYNIRLIRYSDVVLMAAEAACELGGTENLKMAKEYLEQVRSRARGTNTTILPEVTSNDQDVVRQAIRRERRAELALEPDRFYDLVRWDTAKDVLKARGYQARNKYLPLPQAEIDASDGVLIQNPDYAN